MLKKIEDYYFSCRLATEFVLRWKAQGPTKLVFNCGFWGKLITFMRAFFKWKRVINFIAIDLPRKWNFIMINISIVQIYNMYGCDQIRFTSSITLT